MECVADRIAIGAMYEDYPVIWFSNLLYNGLFQYNIETDELRYEGKFPEERVGQLFMHRKAVMYESRLIFFPAGGTHIHVVDLDTMKMNAIPVHGWYHEGSCKVSEAFREGDQYILWPGNWQDAPLRFSPKDGAFEKTGIQLKPSSGLEGYREEVMFWEWAAAGHTVCAALAGTSCIVTGDLSQGTVKYIDTGLPELFGVFAVGEEIWALPLKGTSVYVLNGNMRVIRSYSFDQEPVQERLFNQVAELDRQVVLLPARAEHIYRIEKNRPAAVDSSLLAGAACNDIIGEKFYRYVKNQRELILLPCHYSAPVHMIRDRVENSGNPFRLLGELRKKMAFAILEEALDIGVTIGEENDYTVRDYIRQLCRMGGRESTNTQPDAGRSIYQYLCEME